MSQDTEDLNSTNETTEEVDNTEDIEEVDGADADETEDKPRYTESEMKLFARAKKAEAEAKRLKAEKLALLNAQADAKPKQEIKSDPQPKVSADSVDEKILRATKGYDDDAIEELKFIADRKKISLFAAEQDKRFVTYIKDAEEEKKKAEASLGASKGSGRKKSEPEFSTPGLTAEQHEALWKKQMGL